MVSKLANFDDLRQQCSMTNRDWFETLTGFHESTYQTTKDNLELSAGKLRSKVNGRLFDVGRLETPSLGELRTRGQAAVGELRGKLAVHNMVGDVRQLHANPTYEGSLFQVASQFNLLEMTGPHITPEDGVARYAWDPTQGPACAIAAGAATIYRNYFAKVGAQEGQSQTRQLDCIADLGEALGNSDGSLWTMSNGYALCTEQGLVKINHRLTAATPTEIAALRDLLRIGLQWDVEVTDSLAQGIHVSQAFCSALPLAYSAIPPALWEPLARLVLEAAYEATLWAAVLNYQNSGSRTVHLTMLGGGAFGNDPVWIIDALRRALQLFARTELEVHIVNYSLTPPALDQLALEFT